MSNGDKFSGELLGSDSESIQYLPSKKGRSKKTDLTTNSKEAMTVLLSEVKETRLVITI